MVKRLIINYKFIPSSLHALNKTSLYNVWNSYHIKIMIFIRTESGKTTNEIIICARTQSRCINANYGHHHRRRDASPRTHWGWLLISPFVPSSFAHNGGKFEKRCRRQCDEGFIFSDAHCANEKKRARGWESSSWEVYPNRETEREREREREGEPKSLRGIVRALLPRHAPTFFVVACPLSSESGRARRRKRGEVEDYREAEGCIPWRRQCASTADPAVSSVCQSTSISIIRRP